MSWFIALVVWVGVVGAFGSLLLAEWSRVELEMDQLAERIGPAPLRPARVVRRSDDLLGGGLGRLGSWLTDLLQRAGSDKTPTRVVFEVVLFGLGGMMIGASRHLGAVGFLGIVAGVLPIWRLRRQALRRQRAVTEALPSVMDLLIRALQSGHGFSDALHDAAMETPGPLGDELRVVADQHRLGLPIEDCLESLASRLAGQEEIGLFVGAVLLQRETGGNLVETLSNLGKTVRERLVFEQRLKALTSEIRMSSLILGSLPVFAVGGLWVISPEYLAPLHQTSAGRALAGGVVGLIVIGNLVMRRLGTVRV